MKIMIASDIHGSAYYLEQLLNRYDEENPDKLLLLGDILYHGPRNDLPKGYAPKDVILLLNTHKEEILCVRGNCDTEVDQMVLDFPILADYCILYEKGHMIFATHGHHVPVSEEFDERIYLNPGSVSIPKNGSAHSYMMLEDGLFTWKDLDGNSYKTYRMES